MDIPTHICTQCARQIPVTDRVWFRDGKVYCWPACFKGNTVPARSEGASAPERRATPQRRQE